MINSLFGDLSPPRLPALATDGGRADPQAATSEDLLVDESPAAAMRAHFAAQRQDLQLASQRLTLLDPSQLWASQVLQSLAAAAGQPLQRVRLRERSTLRTLAVIERTLVPRRGADALRVYHADLRAGHMAPDAAHEEINLALAECSQLTAVIVGAMQPHALVQLVRALLQATRQPEWRCPQLVFIVPQGSAALSQRILERHWPPRVKVSTVAEPMGCAAGLWNCVLEAWQSARGGNTPDIDLDALATGAAADAPVRPPVPRAAPAPATLADRAPTRPSPQHFNRLLLPLARHEGLLACGIVDLARGDLLASQQRGPSRIDLDALALRLHAAHQALGGGWGDAPAADELLVTAGPRLMLLRRLPGAASLGFLALLDRQQANLSLLRFKLMDAERALA